MVVGLGDGAALGINGGGGGRSGRPWDRVGGRDIVRERSERKRITCNSSTWITKSCLIIMEKNCGMFALAERSSQIVSSEEDISNCNGQ